MHLAREESRKQDSFRSNTQRLRPGSKTVVFRKAKSYISIIPWVTKVIQPRPMLSQNPKGEACPLLLMMAVTYILSITCTTKPNLNTSFIQHNRSRKALLEVNRLQKMVSKLFPQKKHFSKAKIKSLKEHL